MSIIYERINEYFLSVYSIMKIVLIIFGIIIKNVNFNYALFLIANKFLKIKKKCTFKQGLKGYFDVLN